VRNQNSFRICLPIVASILLTAQLTAAQTGNAPSLLAQGATRFLNPEGLSKPAGFTQVVVAGPSRLVYVSGQTARNAAGEVVGRGDLRAQVTQAMENLKTALTAAGATMQDVVKLNYYVVNLKPDQVPVIREVRQKYLSADHPPASTLVGVTALVQDELMIEVEAIATVR
jgi:enamine deaminase RidA (YjgF/YER057c/UK114 family)